LERANKIVTVARSNYNPAIFMPPRARMDPAIEPAPGAARHTPTMEDVARAAGVSRALVSLVMREQPNVSEERRRRVLEAADLLGYRPNAMARSLASRRTRTVGVVLDDLANPFFAEIAGGVEELASEVGYQLLLGAGGRQARRERAAVATLLEYRVDGIILVSPRMPRSDIAAAAAESPLVIIGRQIRGVGADFVLIDERHGTALVLDHLIELGHERIAHVDGGRGAAGPQRRAAYVRGMQARRLGRHVQVVPGDFTEEAGMVAATQLAAGGKLPTAVFAANDMVAAGLLGGLDRAGVAVPDDVSIVGYDNISIAHLAHVSLTTIDQPRTEMGRLALQLLLDRIDNRRPDLLELIEPKLVVRGTTGLARKG
jgi:DNA-binding LacI/PurR family transcriptional regulator